MADSGLADWARRIDDARAAELRSEYGPKRELSVLLGTAYPPLAPARTWQVEAMDAIAREGWTRQLTSAAVAARVRSDVDGLRDDAFKEALRRASWTLKARIALRELLPPDLGGADVDATSRELSHLADAVVDAALEEAKASVADRGGEPMRRDGSASSLVVFGMGKLGGRELNAGSDVDLNFVYDSDEGASGVDLHRHWTRVVRRAVVSLEEATSDGFVWRVDLRLRPEGSTGALVNSVAATERYYETWGRLWERAALLRARAIAGDLELGAIVTREVFAPFVFRRAVEPALATALAELVARSRVELSEDPERDLKLGPGGIREAEFFIQALQLIWGGREPALRVQGSLVALARLRSQGLVTDREQREIVAAYLLLRRVEHALQWRTGFQTHLLPRDPDELAALARTLGYGDAGALSAELDRARETVAGLFQSLLPTEPRPISPYQAMVSLLGGDEERLAPAVAEVFGDADVAEHLRALARRPDGLLGELTSERHPGLADRVLGAIADSPDPEQAARYLRSFFGRFRSASAYITALAEEPRRAHRLATVLGASSFVGDALVAQPDLAGVVLFGKTVLSDEDARQAVADELSTFEHTRYRDDDERLDGFVGALRRAKGKVTINVAVSDLAGGMSTREATRRLSHVADETLQRTVDFVFGGDTRGISVVAMGKLGGLDIGYASDLDVLFIYDPACAPADHDPAEYFSRAAQRIIRLVSIPHPAGLGYQLDTRLRPSGAQGLLVTSIDSFARYHGVGVDGEPRPSVLSSGAAWERQALLRARPFAGDAALCARVRSIAHVAAYERGAPPPEEVHRLRQRMEAELAREREGHYDLKAGFGGLLDIEFAVQWLQMHHGKDEAVRTTDTGDALEALRRCGFLAESDYSALRDGYTFLRRLEQRIHILRGTGSSTVGERTPGLVQLARRMRFADTAHSTAAQTLMARYRAVTRAVRESYLRVLGV